MKKPRKSKPILFDQMPETDERFSQVVACVEATSAEMHFIWQTYYNNPSKVLVDSKVNITKYDQYVYGSGTCPTVGYFGGMPVTVTCFFYGIDDQMVLFYYGASLVVHHGMIEEWLKMRCKPTTHDGRSGYYDALNFGNALHEIKWRNSKEGLEKEIKFQKERLAKLQGTDLLICGGPITNRISLLQTKLLTAE